MWSKVMCRLVLWWPGKYFLRVWYWHEIWMNKETIMWKSEKRAFQAEGTARAKTQKRKRAWCIPEIERWSHCFRAEGGNGGGSWSSNQTLSDHGGSEHRSLDFMLNVMESIGRMASMWETCFDLHSRGIILTLEWITWGQVWRQASQLWAINTILSSFREKT